MAVFTFFCINRIKLFRGVSSSELHSENNKMKIINPCGYVENARQIMEFFQKAGQTGDKIYINKLEQILDDIIRKRDSLTEQERKVISEIYQDTYLEMIRSGQYLDNLYEIIREIIDEEDRNEDETPQEYIRKKLTIGSIKMAMKIKIKASQEKEEDMKRDMDKFFGNLLGGMLE